MIKLKKNVHASFHGHTTVTSEQRYPVKHGEYYPHIDGIRAFAVIPVVLFHIYAALCPGGFAGVDVFFVISGYLITGGILRDLTNNRFTMRNFYYRRIRRILPAYFTLIVGVFIMGCVLYYAQPLIYLADTTIMGTLFSANLYFYFFSGGYFDASVHSNALLHLWSLSVEEQFYLFIPLLCSIIWKFKRRLVFPLFMAIAVVSLGGAVYAVFNGSQHSAFYLLHFRAWELLAGSLLAMVPLTICHSDVKVPCTIARVHTVLAMTGLMLIIGTYVALSNRTPFPGLAVLPTVAGTALLIRYGQNGWVAQMLSSRPTVFIGKISYSLYLWHWPVTVFWKYAVYEQLHYYDYVGMFLISLLLAYLSWRLVEVPVRISLFWTARRSFVSATFGILLIIMLSSVGLHYRGSAKILHPFANEMAGRARLQGNVLLTHTGLNIIRRVDAALGTDFYNKGLQERKLWLMETGGDDTAIGAQGLPRLLLVGDSHAGVLQYGLDILLEKNKLAGYAITQGATDFFDMQNSNNHRVIRKLEELSTVSSVILVERWLRKDWSDPREVDGIRLRLEQFAGYLNSIGKKLFICTDVPCYYCPLPLNDIAARMQIMKPRHIETAWDFSGQSAEMYSRTQEVPINRVLDEICKKTGAVLIPLHLSLEKEGHFLYYDNQDGNIVPLYKDNDHLSLNGSLRAAQLVMNYVVP